MEDLLNIWNTDDELSEDELMNYVKNKSSSEAAHAVEKKMADSSFINDGVEGLQSFSSTEKLNSYVQKINEDLHKHLRTKKHKRKKAITNSSWEIIAVVIVILLCLLSYAVIEMMKK